LGAIGVATARLCKEKSSIKLVGAVDINPALGADLGVPVFKTIGEAVQKKRAEVAIVTTGSKFLPIQDTLYEAFAAGLHVVSSCEEMLFPWHRYPDQAAGLDRVAQKAKVACLGTGVNPGFVMDTLALVVSGVCQRVDAVRMWRIQDVARRRPQLQKKVGAGMDAAAFRALVAEGKIGHVGLQESLALVAHGLGWKLDKVDEVVEPVIAAQDCGSADAQVKAGQVAGVSQVATGLREGREVLRLDLKMYLAAPEPRDEIQIDGVPPMRVVIPGATPGDYATAAMLVNCAARIVSAPPGLRTMADIPPARAVS
jgi:4-hydroxy-tetrahydrodipicolinate reductase